MKTIKKPFDVHYNPYTQTIEVLDSTDSLTNVIENIKGELSTITNALKKLNIYWRGASCPVADKKAEK